MEIVGLSDYAKLLTLSPDIFLVLDKRKSIVFASPGVSALGYSSDEVLNLPFANFLAGHLRPIVEKKINEAQPRQVYNQRVVLRSKENAYIAYLMTYLLEQDKIYIALRKEENLDSSKIILDTLDFGIILVDTDYRILYHNAYISSYFGKQSFTHLEQLPYGLGAKLIEYIKLGTKNLEPEYAPGKYLGIKIEPYSNNGIDGYIIKLKDITNEKMIQKSMSELDNYFSLGQLASGLAHEIKNPLAGMKFIALSLRRELTSPTHLEMIDRLIKQIDRINALVKTFFSQVKTKAVEFKKCSVKSIVDEIKGFLSNDLIENGIIFEYHKEGSDNVYADQNHLYTIILNLVQNAIDAMRNHKGIRRIDIFTRDSETKCPDCGSKLVEIEVRDTGPGIKKEDLDRIFYPFFTTKAEGVGLGLFLVHKMVKENKGFIRVFSEVGKGTSFIIYLHPVTPEAAGCVKK